MSKVDQNMMSQADYARRRGCSREAVRKAVEAGRISAFGPDKLIDADLADAQWARNTRSRASSGPPTVGPPTPSPAAASAAAGLPEPGGSYLDWRTRREAAEAQAAELALRELRGELVRAADIRQSLARRFAGVREVFLQLPARVVPLLAADPAAASMDRILRAEIVAALTACVESTAPAPRPDDTAEPGAAG